MFWVCLINLVLLVIVKALPNLHIMVCNHRIWQLPFYWDTSMISVVRWNMGYVFDILKRRGSQAVRYERSLVKLQVMILIFKNFLQLRLSGWAILELSSNRIFWAKVWHFPVFFPKFEHAPPVGFRQSRPALNRANDRWVVVESKIHQR